MIRLGVTNFLKKINQSAPKTKMHAGLLTHVNVFDEEGAPVYERMMNCRHLSINVLFGPQHGFFMTTSQAQMQPTPSATHPTRHIPIHSLYRLESRDVDSAWLSDLDAVIVDLPDVGTKVYTYIWSMAKMMIACARVGIPMIVLDRPNPIAGLGVKGPMTLDGMTSFVGLYPIPFCHALTIGEAALYLNEHARLGCPLEIIKMSGWHRHSFFDDYGLAWHPPSPNLRTFEAALHYPCTVMIEATNISEARGTDFPFCAIGAPFINAEQLAADVQDEHPHACELTPVTFTPESDKFAGTRCHGLRLRAADPTAYDPVLLGIALIKHIRAQAPEFEFRAPPYEYEFVKSPFDITLGDPAIREMIEQNAAIQDIQRHLSASTRAFEASIKTKHIYPNLEKS